MGDRLTYEDRNGGAACLREALVLRVTRAAPRRDGVHRSSPIGVPARWRQDRAGNVIERAAWARCNGRGCCAATWQLGAGGGRRDGHRRRPAWLRARLRGQVVAVGPQSVAEPPLRRRGDRALRRRASSGEAFTRVDGAIVVDRASGVLLRLDLRSAQPTLHACSAAWCAWKPRRAETQFFTGAAHRRYGRRRQDRLASVNPQEL
ncbi:MAG: hypothetical protein MZW92_23840 [Comamonadaceae bacterium]|nr:hypothetical protein [Comamonadaceae bacterium]